VLLVIRIPFFIDSLPLIKPELKWMLIGERLYKGFSLYENLWENIAPLSAYLYQVLHFFFGKSQLAYQILSILLIYFQALLFNNLLIRNRAFKENTLIPAFLYILLMNLFFDFNTFSPILISNTFILLAIGNLFNHIENKSAEESMFRIGVNIGLATLFFFPSVLFLIAILIATLFFTGAQVKKYFLLLIGATLPLAIFWLYYFWTDTLDDYYLNLIYPYFYLGSTDYLGINSYTTISFIPLIFIFFSLLLIYHSGRYTSYQIRYVFSMIFMFAVGILVLIALREKSAYHLSLLVPFGSYFISHYFIIIEKKLIRYISSIIFIASVLLVNYGSYFNFMFQDSIRFEELIVKETPYDEVTKNRRILVMGSNIDIYNNSTLATPYLNWHMAKIHFDNLEYQDNLTAIYKNLHADLPEIIIDLENRIPAIFEIFPTIASKYKSGNINNTYLLK
jgi:hypothetical protein